MGYRHRWTDGEALDLPNGKVVCVGRNYVGHVKEFDSPLPTEPLLFVKPDTTLVDMQQPVVIPTDKGAVHHEVELAMLIGETLTHVSKERVESAIVGVGLALDLTLRDIQARLKSAGHPWEKSKAFDGSCPLSGFLPMEQLTSLSSIEFSLVVNGEQRQSANSADMIFDTLTLIAHISEFFTLRPGDLVLTGTPAGVGSLKPGDRFSCSIGELLQVDSVVV